MAFLGHYILAVNCSTAHKIMITKQNTSYFTLKFSQFSKRKTHIWLNIETIRAH